MLISGGVPYTFSSPAHLFFFCLCIILQGVHYGFFISFSCSNTRPVVFGSLTAFSGSFPLTNNSAFWQQVEFNS